MNTPMQELIEQLKESAQLVKDPDDIQHTMRCSLSSLVKRENRMYRSGLREAIEKAESMLKKEKEVIIKAAADHCYPTYGEAMMYAEEYYAKTFNTKER